MSFHLAAGDLNQRIRIERPVASDDFDGAGSGTWQLVAEVSAQIRDVLPSRGEQVAEGVTIGRRPARIRFRWRPDITGAMRILIGRTVLNGADEPVWLTDRIMQIVAGPATLGRRTAIEVVAEEYSAPGNAA